MKKLLAATAVAPWLLMTQPVLADIEIGVINSLSGAFAAFGQRYQAGMEVALEEINSAGGVKGEPISLRVQDDRSEASSALAAVESLNRQDVPLIMGSYASSITGPMAQLMTRKEIPLIVLGSADNSITKPGSPWVFRAKHNSTIVAKTYFDYFDYLRENFDDSLKTVAMLYGNGAWPESLAKEGARLAEERGYEVVGNASYDQGTFDFRPILNRFRAEDPDLLYVVAYAEDGVAIARQLREVNLNAKAVAIDTGAALPSFINQVGDLSEYVATVVSWSKDVQRDGVEDLYQRLKAKTGEEPTFYEAEGYLALRVAADALERAESLERSDVRDALAETDLDTPVTHVKFESFDGFQGQNPIRSLVLQIQDGEHVTVFPADLAAEKVRYPTPSWDER
ncbi:ABC transporter substrate-binding protein [Modicisalibacter luteus]|uniref:ABC transporter substrate-binding protein n=1 Tax=Modicisalibacter luteus TaxID=453962 RepID=A0ABV7M4Z6_9GAMM|nr:ABC transporter substrate-binding protein [Halomonas lutea]GHA88413.1 branched-chain amino acid ABC transporter substrate-binding protein [Halomonas lutea]